MALYSLIVLMYR